jgi:hypothetical protein
MTEGSTATTAPADQDPVPPGGLSWGRTVGVVILGAVIGAGYSLGTRPAASPIQFASLVTDAHAGTPVELATLPDQVAVRPGDVAAIVAQKDRKPVIQNASLPAKPAGQVEFRDLAFRPTGKAVSEKPPMAFQSIATLSTSAPGLGAEIRSLKSATRSEVPLPTAVERTPRPAAGRADAVAAVWGFLAVGLAGSTVAAGPRPTSSSGADRRLDRQASVEEREDGRFLADQGGRSTSRMIGLATFRD